MKKTWFPLVALTALFAIGCGAGAGTSSEIYKDTSGNGDSGGDTITAVNAAATAQAAAAFGQDKIENAEVIQVAVIDDPWSFVPEIINGVHHLLELIRNYRGEGRTALLDSVGE